MSDSRVQYRRPGLSTWGASTSLRMLSIAMVLIGALAVMQGGFNTALALGDEQVDETAPNGAPLSAETQRLFQAVRDGDLERVQQAVLDGADILALNADGTTAADLAESLDRFTITHFLRVYQAIEGYDAAPTTVVETDEPGPVPPPNALAAIDPADTPSSTPMSGLGVVSNTIPASESQDLPSGDVMETSTESASVASLQMAPLSEMPDDVNDGDVPQSDQQAGLLISQEAQEIQKSLTKEPEGDYFSRLSMLNPTHEPVQSEPVAPTGQVTEQAIEGGNDLKDMAAIEMVPTEVSQPSESGTSVVAGSEIITPYQMDEGIISSDVTMAFIPQIPSRKPVEDISRDTSIFASVEQGQPALEAISPGDTVTEMDIAMLAEVPMPEFSQPDIPEEADDSSFFAQMRVFDEGASDAASSQSGDTDGSVELSRNSETVPQFEQIRAAVIEKLRRESNERSRQLAEVREENIEALETETMVREHLSGSMNVQTELRAKERMALTGTDLPPGYVPPPDGGTSGLRFLQRLGLYGGGELASTAEAAISLNAYDHSVLAEAGENVLLPVLSPSRLAKKSLAFVDSGYSAPPAGRSINTAEDNAVAALSQIARLFQSPNVGYSSLTSALPEPGTLPQAVSRQNTVGGITMPEAPSNAPLNSSDLATPPPMDSAAGSYGMESASPDVLIPEIPIGQAELALVGEPFQPSTPQLLPGWDATPTDSQGNGVAVSSSTANGNTGLTTQLSGMFDPVDTSTVMPGAVEPVGSMETGSSVFGSSDARLPIEEATGSWDVVSVQTAPTASRTLLGGAVVPKTSVAVTGSGTLSMGQSVVLGKAPPVGVDPMARKKACIDKRRGSILFCIERIDWPTELQNIMQVDTVMYQGLNAIVRYDNGVATRFHALFPTESFNTIVSYYMQRLGNPTNVWRRTISPLAAPERENPTISWQALNPHTQVTSILEIRQFDDTRGGFPDENRGAVTLYSAHSGPIFPQVSAFELMRLHPGS